MKVHLRTLPGPPELALAQLTNLSSYRCLHLLSLQQPNWPTHSSLNMPSNCHIRVSAFTLIIHFLEIFLQSWLFPSFTSYIVFLRRPFRINVCNIPSVIYTIAILFASYHLSLILSLLIFYFNFSCLCLLAKSLQSCPTLWDLMDCSPPGSSVHGILQARILEWVSMFSSRGISLTKGLNLYLLCLLYWQVGSLTEFSCWYGKQLELFQCCYKAHENRNKRIESFFFCVLKSTYIRNKIVLKACRKTHFFFLL